MSVFTALVGTCLLTTAATAAVSQPSRLATVKVYLIDGVTKARVGQEVYEYMRDATLGNATDSQQLVTTSVCEHHSLHCTTSAHCSTCSTACMRVLLHASVFYCMHPCSTACMRACNSPGAVLRLEVSRGASCDQSSRSHDGNTVAKSVGLDMDVKETSG